MALVLKNLWISRVIEGRLKGEEVTRVNGDDRGEVNENVVMVCQYGAKLR